MNQRPTGIPNHYYYDGVPISFLHQVVGNHVKVSKSIFLILVSWRHYLVSGGNIYQGIIIMEEKQLIVKTVLGGRGSYSLVDTSPIYFTHWLSSTKIYCILESDVIRLPPAGNQTNKYL